MGILNAFPSGSDGVKIQNDGIDTIEREKLNFLDHDVTDNFTDKSTDVAPHRLTAAELQDIVSPLPGYQTGGVVVSPNEQQIGWYYNMNGDGTRKPLYQKTVVGTITTANAWNFFTHNISNFEFCINIFGVIKDPAGVTSSWSLGGWRSNEIHFQLNVSTTEIGVMLGSSTSFLNCDVYVTVQYTKTTDTYA